MSDQEFTQEPENTRRGPGRPRTREVFIPRKRRPEPEVDRATHVYPSEIKAKAYNAFLNGCSLSDCARAIEHPDPAGTGATTIRNWVIKDHWVRDEETIESNYMQIVTKDRARDPKRISDEIDELCLEMQQVAEYYVHQFIGTDGKVNIPKDFKTRDFTDMAAALRMIHDTRIKLRRALDPPKQKSTEGMGFLTLIQEATARRAKETRKSEFAEEQVQLKRARFEQEEYPDGSDARPSSRDWETQSSASEDSENSETQSSRVSTNLAELRARIEQSAGSRSTEAADG